MIFFPRSSSALFQEYLRSNGSTVNPTRCSSYSRPIGGAWNSPKTEKKSGWPLRLTGNTCAPIYFSFSSDQFLIPVFGWLLILMPIRELLCSWIILSYTINRAVGIIRLHKAETELWFSGEKSYVSWCWWTVFGFTYSQKALWFSFRLSLFEEWSRVCTVKTNSQRPSWYMGL